MRESIILMSSVGCSLLIDLLLWPLTKSGLALIGNLISTPGPIVAGGTAMAVERILAFWLF